MLRAASAEQCREKSQPAEQNPRPLAQLWRKRAARLSGLGLLVLLLLTGCRTAVTSGTASSQLSKWTRPPLLWRSKQQSLREAVESDPFPRADQDNFQMAVR